VLRQNKGGQKRLTMRLSLAPLWALLPT